MNIILPICFIHPHHPTKMFYEDYLDRKVMKQFNRWCPARFDHEHNWRPGPQNELICQACNAVWQPEGEQKMNLQDEKPEEIDDEIESVDDDEDDDDDEDEIVSEDE